MNRTIGIIECNYSSALNDSLTQSRPAASVPFHGRYRLVDFPLSNMVNAGIDTIGLIMPTHYRSIIDHVGAGKEWGLARKRGGIFPAPGSPFGTAHKGGRFLLRDIIDNKAILLRNDYDYVIFSTANFVMNVDFGAMIESHANSGADITVLAANVPESRSDENVVGLSIKEGKVAGVSTGVQSGDIAFLDAFVIGRKCLFNLIEVYAAYDYLDLFEAMANDFDRYDIRAFMHEGYSAPVFTMPSYYSVSMDLLDNAIASQVFTADRVIKTKSHDTTPAKYEKGCAVSRSLISSSCKIYGEVSESILGRHVIVEPGAVVKNSIIMQGVIVKSGARIENAIIDRNNVIAANTVIAGSPENVFYYAKSDDYLVGADN